MPSQTKRVVGIDPGLTGAIAVIGADGEPHAADAPRLDAGKGELNMPYIIEALKRIAPDLVVIERQQAMPFLGKSEPCKKCGRRPTQGVASSFKTGYGYGLYVGVLAALKIPFVVVSAQTWQKVMYKGAVGKGKERSMYICGQRWPNVKLKRAQHGRADAMLLAEYGRSL